MEGFNLPLSDYTRRKLTEAARAAEVTPGRMAGLILEAWLRDEVGPDPEPARSGVDEPARAWADEPMGGAAPSSRRSKPGDPVVRLAEPMASRLAGMARTGGVAQAVLAAAILDSRLFDYDDFKWPAGGDPREDNAATYDLNEVGRPWSEVRPEMVALLERKLAERK